MRRREMAASLRDRVAAWRPCLGLGIGTDSVRGVLVRDGKAIWRAERSCAPGESRRGAVEALIAALPAAHRRRLRIVAAFGPRDAQVKLLNGLPRTGSATLLRSVVSESAGRYFTEASGPLVISPVLPAGEGAGWAAAIDAIAVNEVTEACTAVGLSLETILPTAVALAFSAHDEALTWDDGDARLLVERAGDALLSVRRVRTTSSGDGAAPTRLVPGMRALGADAWTYADAHGAACANRSSRLAIALSGRTNVAPVTGRRRIMLAGAAAGAIAQWIVGPVLVAQIVLARSRPAENNTPSRVAEARRLDHASRTHLHDVEALRAFKGSRNSAISLLGVLTDALPDSAYLTALHLRDGEGTIEIDAPDASDAIAALNDADSLANVALAGAVTSEVMAGQRRDHATVHFRWKGHGSVTPSDAPLLGATR